MVWYGIIARDSKKRFHILTPPVKYVPSARQSSHPYSQAYSIALVSVA